MIIKDRLYRRRKRPKKKWKKCTSPAEGFAEVQKRSARGRSFNEPNTRRVQAVSSVEEVGPAGHRQNGLRQNKIIIYRERKRDKRGPLPPYYYIVHGICERNLLLLSPSLSIRSYLFPFRNSFSSFLRRVYLVHSLLLPGIYDRSWQPFRRRLGKLLVVSDARSTLAVNERRRELLEIHSWQSLIIELESQANISITNKHLSMPGSRWIFTQGGEFYSIWSSLITHTLRCISFNIYHKFTIEI